MTACLTIFPPSNKFHLYLEGYIYKYLDVDDLSPVAVEVSLAIIKHIFIFCKELVQRRLFNFHDSRYVAY